MKRIMKLILLTGLFSLIFGVFASVSTSVSAQEDTTVGISMPPKSLERWERDGEFMVELFDEQGYATDLQFAQDVPTQVSQLENMITRGVDALVIGSIDGEALTDVVNRAGENGIAVIAYDRLIMNTDGVDYYATFDTVKVGEQQAQYIVDTLDLDNQEGPFNVELFGGSPDDNNAYHYFEGAMSVLQPYIDEGKVVIKSGQTQFNELAIQDWDGATAQARMDNLLSAHYTDDMVHGILAPNDATALGIVSSLQSVGYGSDDRPMPVITGQDAELASVQSIIDGGQTMTVFKDTRDLASVAVNMVTQMMNEEEVEVNDTETYDNNVAVIPSFLLETIPVDSDNYEEVLIDGGYINEADLN